MAQAQRKQKARDWPFEVKPLHPALGCEIIGITLAQAVEPAMFGKVYEAFLDYELILFRDVDLPPATLFPGALADGPAPRPERLLFVVSHERPEITVEPIEPAAVAERMCASLAEEDQRLVSCYHKFRFAFPTRRNAFFERANERRRELLHAALAHTRAYEVRHPYPVELPALYEALAGVCR